MKDFGTKSVSLRGVNDKPISREKTEKRMNSLIGEGVKFIQEELGSNPILQKRVVKKVVENKIIKTVEHDYDVSCVDLENELKSFIQFQQSEETRKNYKNWTKEFLVWCVEKKINPLKIDRGGVESYLVWLGETNSSNSIRSKIMGVCSLYKYLMIRHPETFLFNPFHKLPLPKKVTVRKQDIVTEGDIKTLRKEFVRIKREDLVFCLDLMTKYGWRVGSFKKMTVNKNGQFKIETKGSIIESGKNGWGKLTRTEVEKFHKLKIGKLDGGYITRMFQKYNNKLFQRNEISCIFSPHDIRHYCITKQIGNCKTSGDMIKTSRKYHKQFQTTVDYCWYK